MKKKYSQSLANPSSILEEMDKFRVDPRSRDLRDSTRSI